MRILTIFILLSCSIFAQKNEPFQGAMFYKVTMTDTAVSNLYPEKEMRIITNDTMVRIENFTEQLGWQYLIKHLQLSKSYLLLETVKGNYAIQTKNPADVEKPNKYGFEKKGGKLKIAGLKCKRLVVTNEQFEQPAYFFYTKKYSSKYLDGFENFPGLLTLYFIPTPDGIYQYQLMKIESFVPAKDVFGIPSDFERVSMEQFIQIMTSSEEN